VDCQGSNWSIRGARKRLLVKGGLGRRVVNWKEKPGKHYCYFGPPKPGGTKGFPGPGGGRGPVGNGEEGTDGKMSTPNGGRVSSAERNPLDDVGQGRGKEPMKALSIWQEDSNTDTTRKEGRSYFFLREHKEGTREPLSASVNRHVRRFEA